MVINSDKINSKGKGRPPVPDNIKAAVLFYNKRHPGWSANKILEQIHRAWFNGLENKHPDWTREEIESYIKLPAANTVNKYIRENKPENDQAKCLGKVWQLSLIDKYKKEINPDALFEISQIQHFCEIVNLDEFRPITVRQALWIAKLLPFAPYFQAQWETNKEIHKKNELYNWRLISLYRWSQAYAEYQAMCNLASTIFDTAELDKGLRTGAIPLTAPDIQVQGTTLSKTGAVMLLQPDSDVVSLLTPDKEAYNKSVEIIYKKEGEK